VEAAQKILKDAGFVVVNTRCTVRRGRGNHGGVSAGVEEVRRNFVPPWEWDWGDEAHLGAVYWPPPRYPLPQ
jgi:hypothetical protein